MKYILIKMLFNLSVIEMMVEASIVNSMLCDRGEKLSVTKDGIPWCDYCDNGTYMAETQHNNTFCHPCDKVENETTEEVFEACSREKNTVIMCRPGYEELRPLFGNTTERCGFDYSGVNIIQYTTIAIVDNIVKRTKETMVVEFCNILLNSTKQNGDKFEHFNSNIFCRQLEKEGEKTVITWFIKNATVMPDPLSVASSQKPVPETSTTWDNTAFCIDLVFYSLCIVVAILFMCRKRFSKISFITDELPAFIPSLRTFLTMTGICFAKLIFFIILNKFLNYQILTVVVIVLRNLLLLLIFLVAIFMYLCKYDSVPQRIGQF